MKKSGMGVLGAGNFPWGEVFLRLRYFPKAIAHRNEDSQGKSVRMIPHLLSLSERLGFFDPNSQFGYNHGIHDRDPVDYRLDYQIMCPILKGRILLESIDQHIGVQESH